MEFWKIGVRLSPSEIAGFHVSYLTHYCYVFRPSVLPDIGNYMNNRIKTSLMRWGWRNTHIIALKSMNPHVFFFSLPKSHLQPIIYHSALSVPTPKRTIDMGNYIYKLTKTSDLSSECSDDTVMPMQVVGGILENWGTAEPE